MSNTQEGESPKLIIIRGVPGSGKSTLAKTYVEQGFRHFETDNYFIVDGKYSFNPDLLKHNHARCLCEVTQALELGFSVVVSNTFTQKWEMQKYIDLGYPTEIIEATGKYDNVHGVPQEIVEKMRKRWEKVDFNSKL